MFNMFVVTLVPFVALLILKIYFAADTASLLHQNRKRIYLT